MSALPNRSRLRHKYEKLSCSKLLVGEGGQGEGEGYRWKGRAGVGEGLAGLGDEVLRSEKGARAFEKELKPWYLYQVQGLNEMPKPLQIPLQYLLTNLA